MAQPGDTIGPYVIDTLIAEGGMGAVYRARNRVTGQLRALKIVKEDLAKKGDFVDRFVREATIASQVRHPYLVETLEPGIDKDTIYLPMELLDGETLHARVRRIKRMDAHQMAAILGPVSEAMQALHDMGLVHRDLKPMNVFLAKGPNGEVAKVLDFGTARELEDDEHTKTGMVVGSPFYMSPEQAEGRRDIDARADQYALGVIAYQLVTGHRPYETDDTSALAKLLRGDPYPPPRRYYADVSPELEQVIVRALHRDRTQRFPRIVDFGAALIRAAASSPVLPAGAQSPLTTSSPGITSSPGLLASSSEIRMRGQTGPNAQSTALLNPPTPTGVSLPLSAAPEGASVVTGQGRNYALIGAVVAVLGLLGIISAAIGWQLAPTPEVTTTELLPRTATSHGALSEGAAGGPTAVSGVGAPVDPTPAILEVSPPEVSPPLVDPSTVVLPEGVEAPDEPVEAGARRTGRSGRTARGGSGTGSSGTGGSSSTAPVLLPSGSGDPRGGSGGSDGTSRDDDEPCGAATGIPCLD